MKKCFFHLIFTKQCYFGSRIDFMTLTLFCYCLWTISKALFKKNHQKILKIPDFRKFRPKISHEIFDFFENLENFRKFSKISKFHIEFPLKNFENFEIFEKILIFQKISNFGDFFSVEIFFDRFFFRPKNVRFFFHVRENKFFNNFFLFDRKIYIQSI